MPFFVAFFAGFFAFFAIRILLKFSPERGVLTACSPA
jgi:hypothetical protein